MTVPIPGGGQGHGRLGASETQRVRTDLWSVSAPARPARQHAESSVMSETSAPSRGAARKLAAELETMRRVLRGASGGSSLEVHAADQATSCGAVHEEERRGVGVS
eukprot:6213639-Pleurochrysis_carterae.AAC.3